MNIVGGKVHTIGMEKFRTRRAFQHTFVCCNFLGAGETFVCVTHVLKRKPYDIKSNNIMY